MTPEEQYKEGLLINAIEGCKKQQNVIIAGINSDKEEIELFEVYKDQLIEAIAFLKTTQCIVSLSEFRKIKYEIAKSNENIAFKMKAIKEMESFFKQKQVEMNNFLRDLDRLRIHCRRGLVVPFRRVK